MNYCIDFKTDKNYTIEPTYSEIKEDFLNSIKKENVSYFGELPDNDSDGQDELLTNSTYYRVVYDMEKDISQEEIINLIIKILNANPTIKLRLDTGETKTDTYIKIYI